MSATLFKQSESFHQIANKIDSAGAILERTGMKNQEIYNTQIAFLGLMMVESRIIRNFRRKALDYVLKTFNESGQQMIAEGLKFAEANNLTEEEIIAASKEFNTQSNFFGEARLDGIFSSLLTYAAIYMNTTRTEEEIEEVKAKGMVNLADWLEKTGKENV